MRASVLLQSNMNHFEESKAEVFLKAALTGGVHFARCVPGQGSWRAFTWCSSFPNKHCKDFRVWVHGLLSVEPYDISQSNCKHRTCVPWCFEKKQTK